MVPALAVTARRAVVQELEHVVKSRTVRAVAQGAAVAAEVVQSGLLAVGRVQAGVAEVEAGSHAFRNLSGSGSFKDTEAQHTASRSHFSTL